MVLNLHPAGVDILVMGPHAALALQGGPTCPLIKLLSVPCGKPSQYAIGLGLLLFSLGTMLSAIIRNTNWPVILSPCVAVWLDPWGQGWHHSTELKHVKLEKFKNQYKSFT